LKPHGSPTHQGALVRRELCVELFDLRTPHLRAVRKTLVIPPRKNLLEMLGWIQNAIRKQKSKKIVLYLPTPLPKHI
jgi:hypothetical protein